MVKSRSLPLGVDIGSTRLRVAHACETAEGPRICAIAVRDLSPGIATSGAIADAAHVSAVLEDALAELKTRERRCVSAIGEPDGRLRCLRFPKMSALERERSARFEAQRHIEFPIEEATVRVHPATSRDSWLIGVARNSAVITRCAALRGARLKPVAMDHESCALLRALPEFDAILDIGYGRSTLHVATEEGPASLQVPVGGVELTRAIERELTIDERTAEKRKRILGAAGAGERAQAALVGDLAALIQRARRLRRIDRIALCGNGARLARLSSDLASAAAAVVEIPVSKALRSQAYPEDVIRSGAPDWTLAAGLALWRI